MKAGSLRGIVWLASGVVALLLVAAAVIGLRDTPPDRTARPPTNDRPPASARQPDPVPPPAATAARPAIPAPAPALQPPSFDIVSVDRRGQAVIAGRAMPGDTVRVLDGDKKLGEVTADARGEWVLLPETPIPPGNRQLALEATGRGGGAARRSADVVALSVAPPPAVPSDSSGGTSAVAVLLPGDPNAPPRVLQRSPAPGDHRGLSLDAAGYGAQDELLLSGSAEPGARVNIYAGERLLGTATADGAGKWSLQSSYKHPTGGVELRLDQLAADGSVARRSAAPFNLPAGMAIRDGDTYVVERGNSLWVIAQRFYGQGTRYTAIYTANQDQIRDPHWIYPGQQFRLPNP